MNDNNPFTKKEFKEFNTIKEIVRKCYLKYLNREPDYAGLEHFTTLIQTNQIDEKFSGFWDNRFYLVSGLVFISLVNPLYPKSKLHFLKLLL